MSIAGGCTTKVKRWLPLAARLLQIPTKEGLAKEVLFLFYVHSLTN